MTSILIVYATDYGNTKKMAEAIAQGARSVEGTTVVISTAEEATKEQLLACDALILGSPVHMGSPDWRVKQFIDKVCSGLWMKDALIGRVGGVFAAGGGFGNAGSGCEITMIALLNNLVELGLIIIPLPKNTPGYYQGGIQWGPYGRTQGMKMEQLGLQPDALECARHHGVHIARAATQIQGRQIFSNEAIAIR